MHIYDHQLRASQELPRTQDQINGQPSFTATIHVHFLDLTAHGLTVRNFHH